jgi:hypothetical protein
MPPIIKASEVTTEITTEDITTIETTTEGVVADDEPIDLTDTLNKAKTWIMAGIIYLITSGLLSTIGYKILRKLKDSAFEQIQLAKDSNQISQKAADKATEIVEKGVNLINSKFTSFETNVIKKVVDLDTNVKTLIDKFDSEFLDLFKEAITEYLTEPEEAGE